MKGKKSRTELEMDVHKRRWIKALRSSDVGGIFSGSKYFVHLTSELIEMVNEGYTRDEIADWLEEIL